MQTVVRRKLNLKVIIPLVVGILAVFLLIFGVWTMTRSRFPKELKVAATERKGDASMKSDYLSEDAGYFAYFYPKSGYKGLDAYAKEVTAKHQEKNKEKFANSERTDYKYQQDYSYTTYQDRYVSVAFVEKLDGAEIGYESRVFDVKTGEAVSPESVLTPKAQRLATHHVRELMDPSLDRKQIIETSKLSAETPWSVDDEVIAFYGPAGKKEYKTTENAQFFIEPPVQTTKTQDDIPSVYLDSGVDPQKKLIAMTYDDGPHYENTEELIELFKQYEGQATFFTVGNRIEGQESILRSILDSGNQLASHTFDHPNLNKATPEQIQEQLKKTEDSIRKATGYEGQIMVRPPYGNANTHVLDNSDVTFINWSVDSNDWRHKDGQTVCDVIVNNAHDGGIVLMHDLYKSTVEGSRCALEKLSAQGYQFVTVEELLEAKGIHIEKKKIYFDAEQ